MTKIVEMIDEFKLNQEIVGRKKAYIDVCLYRLNRWKDFMDYRLGVTNIEDVKSIHIKRYVQECQSIGKEGNSTINNSLATLKVFFQQLVDEEFINEHDNPMKRIRNLKEEKTVIVTFNDDEVARILNDVKEETYSNVRDKLILIMLFDTGVRVSELCDIKLDDIASGYILIHGKGSKQRLVYISRVMRKYMRKYEQMKKERFKHKNIDEIEYYYFLDQSALRLSRSRINKILKEHCANAGVRKEVRCSPHDCRHYFAQKQLRNGIDIYSLSRLMGHFDTQITSKYLRGLEQEDILNIGRMNSPLKGVKIIKK
ncbi:tyrosine-type recombinase/integrase [Gottfriedia sp. OAE603]|uniref:tyrosine-type recombinase/integrase n=1 Tax=Gottfriedia sp. OAE603 TaxID=2663872 RepID=UPI00178955F7